MNSTRPKRKLSAILSADVEGYSRLMSDDELATIRTLRSYQEIISKLIKEHRGRVVDSPGDNLLAEFSSAVDATECAVGIQENLTLSNDRLPEDRKMRYRIGINLGELIEEEGKIYGDGINIAARLESLAKAGGVCISASVHDQVKSKIGIKFENLGKQALKNISEPIEVWRAQLQQNTATSEIEAKKRNRTYKTDFPLPVRPSIAVLPFTNMSGDPEQDYFADGISDNIITALSRTSEMDVIAQHSTFAYKGKSINIKEIGEELGVKYALEGSFQKSTERVRINAQLIDAESEHHLWAERYDRNLEDLFALQDEITLRIMRALQVKLTRGEQVRLWEGGTRDLNAFETYYQALDEYLRRGNYPRAYQLCEEAINIDPGFIEPTVWLGWLCMVDYWYNLSKAPEQSREKAVELVDKALAMNDLIDLPHSLLGKILYSYRKYEEAIAAGERGVFLNPSGADACAHLACILTFSGMPDKAFYWLDKAFRLNPMPPIFYYAYSGMAYNVVGRYEEAIEVYRRGLTINPNYLYGCIGLAESYSLLGRDDEAGLAATQVRRIHPKYSAEYHMQSMQYRNPDDEKRFYEALRKVGL